MEEQLEIIPVLVVAASQNQAEMLNGLLRAHGVAAHASWTNQLDGWDRHGAAPEVVLYVTENEKLGLDEVVSRAAAAATPVVVVSRERSPNAAAQAMETGAADWVSTDEGQLLAAVVRRERARRHRLHRVLELEQAIEHHETRLKSLISSSQDAIAHLQDGVIIDANPAWTERFGGGKSDAVLGVPIMDLFEEGSRTLLKGALKSALRGQGQPQAMTLGASAPDGSVHDVTVEVSRLPGNGQSQLQIAVRGHEASMELELQIEELEQERRRLAEEIQAFGQRERGTNVLWPATFAPIAAERLNRPLEGEARAVVAFRPVDLPEATRLLGPLGLAEVGPDVSAALSSMLLEGDVATRLDNLTALALVDRKDEDAVNQWIGSVLRVLGSHIFEAGARSTHLGFSAGYAIVDRIRQLDALAQQAMRAAEGPEGTMRRGAPEKPRAAFGVSSVAWDAFIPEALKEHRFAITLAPIEDLASGAKLHVAFPCLLDRAGNELGAEVFLRPAQSLGLLENIERKLLGYAFIAQLQMQHAGESTRMLVPLSIGALEDRELPSLLRSLGKHPSARAVMKSLVIEFNQEEIAGRIREVGRASREFQKLGCELGIRDFTVTGPSEQLLEDLPFATVRLAPDLLDLLDSDEDLRLALRSVAERSCKNDVVVIASGVSDANTMAMLYNLGVGTIEGPVIGEPVLFSPAASEEEPLLKELGTIA